MLHFSCDICGKDLMPGGRTRYVVKLEAYAAADPAELTDDDTDPDQVEEMRTYWLSVHPDAQDLPNVRAVIDFILEIVREKKASF